MSIKPSLLLFVAFAVSACGESSPPEAPAQKPAAAAEAAQPAALPRTAAVEGARVFFISPSDGETVSNPVVLEFGIEGMSVAKAGDQRPDSGHHHLIINAELPDFAQPIPANANYKHFGDGSTSTEITLEPGEHTLQLLLGDHLHIPHEPPVYSEQITVIVE